MKKITQIAVALACVTGFASSALALDGQALYLSASKGACSGCHGANGKKIKPVGVPQAPKLAGQNADYAFNQMKDIGSGARNNGATAMMKPMMALTTDEEKRAIAEWLSTQ